MFRLRGELCFVMCGVVPGCREGRPLAACEGGWCVLPKGRTVFRNVWGRAWVPGGAAFGRM